MPAKTPNFLFHCTVGPKLELIERSGALLPKGYGGAPLEKPVLWLSENSEWEPTATKAMSRDQGATYVRPSLADLQRLAGLFRFRVDVRQLTALKSGISLVPWNQMPSTARIQPVHVADMIKRGLSFGAKPMHWWGCLDALPIALQEQGALILETCEPVVQGQPLQWTACPLSDAIEAVKASGRKFKMSTATATPAARGV